jgi:hypothetical protein
MLGTLIMTQFSGYATVSYRRCSKRTQLQMASYVGNRMTSSLPFPISTCLASCFPKLKLLLFFTFIGLNPNTWSKINFPNLQLLCCDVTDPCSSMKHFAVGLLRPEASHSRKPSTYYHILSISLVRLTDASMCKTRVVSTKMFSNLFQNCSKYHFTKP